MKFRAWWEWSQLEVSIEGARFAEIKPMDYCCRGWLTTQTPGIAYPPSAAFASMMFALFSRRSCFIFFAGGPSVMVHRRCGWRVAIATCPTVLNGDWGDGGPWARTLWAAVWKSGCPMTSPRKGMRIQPYFMRNFRPMEGTSSISFLSVNQFWEALPVVDRHANQL